MIFHWICSQNVHVYIQDEEYADVGGTLYNSNEGIRETLEAMNDPNEDGW
jgi:hypothetical protein